MEMGPTAQAHRPFNQEQAASKIYSKSRPGFWEQDGRLHAERTVRTNADWFSLVLYGQFAW